MPSKRQGVKADEGKQPATVRKRTRTTKDTKGIKKAPDKAIQGPKKKHAGGRKKAWDILNMSSKIEAVKGWTMQGATMDELGDMLGVSTSTIYEWQKEKPEFAQALRAGRHVANGELIASAFRQSTGYTVTERMAIKVKTWEWVKDPENPRLKDLRQVERIEIVDIEKSVPANAQITQFMLRNRLPDHYKDKQTIEHAGLGNGDYSYMTDEELEAEIERMERLERGESE